MALSHERKQAVVAETKQLLGDAKLTVLAKYPGTSVQAMQQLRRDARAGGTSVRVIKNRLFKVAMSQLPSHQALAPGWLAGQLLYAFNAEDEVAPAQALAEFAKTQPQIEFVGGLTAEGELLSADEVKVLAALPTKDQLRGQLVGVFSAPLRDLVGAMHSNLRGLAQVLAARAESLEN